jgi:hypothetical protein
VALVASFRPITEAASPKDAAKAIVAELSRG